MRTDNLHPRSNLNMERHHFFKNIEGLEKTDSMKKDGAPWDSMVGVRAIGN